MDPRGQDVAARAGAARTARPAIPGPAWLAVALLTVLLSAALAPARVVADLRLVVLGSRSGQAAEAVRRAGGVVEQTLRFVPGVVARVPEPAAGRLASVAGLSVAPERVLRPASAAFGPDAPRPVHLSSMNLGSLWGPSAGEGATVALVDTGVVESPDLAGRVVGGIDLTADGDGVDRYGHGTFMAGLIAGDGTASAAEAVPHRGVAPGARIVSVKVADRTGETTLSRLIEGIGWVVSNRGTYGIRVVNLSFGVSMPGAYESDPLSTAVEAAWASGLVVVAASGNDGDGIVTAPGRDPFVLTAGAVDTAGTADLADDVLPSWSGQGRAQAVLKPEVVAPGVSVVSLRAPGSTIDEAFPAARVDSAYFRGSGTSMAAALVSGAAAILAARHPQATPDDVKGALAGATVPLAGSVGGVVDVARADAASPSPAWEQRYPMAADLLGIGLPRSMPWIEAGPTGTRWNGTRWNGTRWNDSSWEGTRWNGTRWNGTRWNNSGWEGTRWNGTRWNGTRWNGTRWNESSWDAALWGEAPAP